jgi:hypothetical protein
MSVVIGLAASVPSQAQIRDTTVQFGPKLITEGRSWVRVVPGAQYDAGAFHRFFFGGLWRDLWATPIDVPVLNLDTFAGGLTPYKRGGGFQTKSLRFTAANGHQYKFRSLDKDPTSVLPEDLRETFVGDIVQDFIATSNPVSMVVAVPIVNAAGIINAEPMIVVLPDDARLGEYREVFGGLLGALEENPIDDADDGEVFAGAEKIILTPKLFERLQKDNDEKVDARSYLTARLIDVYMGDWDRHTDQWKWARYEEGGEKLWRPIPRDRDQAFCRYNGIIPDLVEVYVPQIEGVASGYPALKYLTWAGRHMDNRFLSELDKPTWDSIATAVKSRMTDSVLEYAVHQLPAAMYQLEGENLRQVMVDRRDALQQAADEFYRVKADVVDVYGSDKGEFAEVIRRDNQHVEVSLYDLDSRGRPKSAPRFHRIFDRDYTDEVRIYMEGGDDSVVVRGDVAASSLVRVIGGDGADVLVDNSRVDGWLLGLLPIPSAETKTRLYDSGRKTSVVEGASTAFDDSEAPEPKKKEERYEPPVPDRGFEWLYFPWVSVSPDLGAFLGGSATLTEWGFRVVPYRDKMVFKAGYATGPQKIKAEFNGDFRKAVTGAALDVTAGFSGIEVLNFFGLGNETRRDESLFNREFYRVEQQQGIVRTTLSIPVIDGIKLSIGAEGRFINTDPEKSTFLFDSSQQFYGRGKFTQAGGILGVTIDTRDNASLPRSGLFVTVRGTYYSELFNLPKAYGHIAGDARTYLTANAGIPFTLALRAAGESVPGTYPYFDAAFLGGLGSLRGFDNQRFAGDASALGAAELRATIGKVRLVVPMTLHLFGFTETGRVFLDGETSERWHPVVGGGIGITVVEPQNTISISVGRSDERIGVYVTSGFGF